jgi:predicted tellurium resistance membrane protein TerC
MTRPFVRTRGGLLVALVVLTAVGFELRTVAAMLFGLEIPAEPYMLAVLLVVAVAGVLMEFSRSTARASHGR